MVTETANSELVTHRKNENDRKCYAVKISIEKSPRCKAKDSRLPPCEPEFNPPADGQDYEKRANKTRVCIQCQSKRKLNKEKRREIRERQINSWNSKTEQTKRTLSTQQCQTESPCTFTDAHCQTMPVTKEVKQCGHQTSVCGTCTKECQTDLEHACAATGVPHNRKCCTKPCCNRHPKQEQPHYPSSNCHHVIKPKCETQHVFPFAGRTPSGNLKVRPSMISYEHKEFGVLVANPQSIRTKVERLTKCEKTFPHCPKSPPPRRHCKQDQLLNSGRPRPQLPQKNSPKQDCYLSCSRNPNTKPFLLTKHSPPGYCNDDLEHPRETRRATRCKRPPEPIKPSNKPGYTYKSQNELGHTHEWNYVNPMYGKRKQTQTQSSRQNDFSPYQSVKSYSEKATETSRQAVNDVQRLQTIVNNPFVEGYLEKGMHTWNQINDTGDYFDYSFSEGSHNSGLPRRREECSSSNNDECPPPYVPAFPQDRNARSDSEDYGNSTELETIATENTTFGTDSLCSRHKKDATPELIGKLHYLVKGAVDADTRVVVGDAEFPVHSVVLEIHSKLFDSGNYHSTLDGVKNIKLPEFMPLPTHDIQGQEGKKREASRRKDEIRETSRRKEEPPRSPQNTFKEKIEKYIPPQAVMGFSIPDEIRRKADELRQQAEEKINRFEFEHLERIPSDEVHLEPHSMSSPPLHIETQDTIFRIVEPNSDGLMEPVVSTTANSTPSLPNQFEADQSISVLPNLDTQQGCILVFGGINPKMPCGPDNTGRNVYLYALDANTWTHVGVLPHSRAHFGLARVDISVYVVGGADPEHKDGKGKNLPVKSNLRLNLRSGEWDSLPELEKPRSHFGCVAIGSNVYVIGGNIDSRPSSSCLVFNTENHSWKAITPLETTRANMGIAVLSNKILIAGGTTKSSKKPVLETVTCYDPDVDRWTAWESLPTPRAFCSLEVARGRVYAIGGAGIKDVSKRKNSSLGDIIWYSEAVEHWVKATELSNPRHGHASIVSGDNIVIVGGVSSHFMGPLSSVEIFSASSEQLRNGKSIKNSSSGISGVAL